jgi:hypothetical protein
MQQYRMIDAMLLVELAPALARFDARENLTRFLFQQSQLS